MKAYKARQWSWDMQGLSMHQYTVVRWPPAYKSVGFGETFHAPSTPVLKMVIGTSGGAA